MQHDAIHLEAPYLPPAAQVRQGFTVFRTDTGTCHRFVAGQWEEQPVPEGKFWFTPDQRIVIHEDGGWKEMVDD